MTDLIDKAAQLNISHFTVYDFVNEIASLREQLSNMMAVVASVEKERDVAEHKWGELLTCQEQLAAMTKERDELVARANKTATYKESMANCLWQAHGGID